MPPELDRIIRKALARRLDERYASAADLAVDLRALHRRLVSGTYEHVAPNPRRRWRTRGVATAAVLGLSALAAWSWSAARPAGIPEATPHQVTSAAGWEAEAKISPDGREIVYAAEAPDGNVDIWIADSEGSSNPRRLTDGPALDRSPAWYPNGRGIVFASEQGGMSSVWRVGRLGTDTPTLIVENAREPAISPDGSRLAFTRPGRDGHQRILVASLDAVAAPAVLTTDADGLWDHEYPAWSPDGKTICYGGHTDLWKVGVASRRTERLTSDGEADYEPTWSPDGKWIYFTSLRGGTTAIWRIRASGGAPERVTLGSGPESQPSLSADGTRLSYSTFSATPNIAIRTLPAGHEYELGGGRSEAGPGLARDGSAVAYSSDSLKSPPDLYVQKLGTSGAPMGQARRLTEFPGSSTHPSFSPDGRWVAFYRVLDSQRDIWIVPVEGGEASRFTDDPAADYHPDWSPDGRQIAFVSERGGGAHLWSRPVKDGKADGPARRLTDGPSGQMAPSWSPDSSLVAFIATDDRQATEAWIVDVQRPLSTRQVTHGAEARRVGWMGDGTGSLLVSGLWGTGRLELRVVGIRDGRVRPVGAPGLFGHQDSSGEFSATPDGRLLAVERVAATGDVWVVTATRGRY
jgi:Tol biopolymer transport system component